MLASTSRRSPGCTSRSNPSDPPIGTPTATGSPVSRRASESGAVCCAAATAVNVSAPAHMTLTQTRAQQACMCSDHLEESADARAVHQQIVTLERLGDAHEADARVAHGDESAAGTGREIEPWNAVHQVEVAGDLPVVEIEHHPRRKALEARRQGETQLLLDQSVQTYVAQPHLISAQHQALSLATIEQPTIT